ncbi:MAG: ABC transporter permease [Planctomyces sp.]|nr:ABC transporter permease [Planctomyces sp.]
MTTLQLPYDLLGGVLHWLAAVLVVCAVGLFVGMVVSLLTVGPRGPGLVVDVLQRGLHDMLHMSARRIGAIASLTMKESFRKKAFAVLVVFIILFLMAGFFLRNPERPDDLPAKPYIAFVLMTIRWLTLPVALLLACWGLPTDIKDRSLHTVVTKPVRRSEIMIGRFLGYGAVTTIFLLVMSLIGYVFINRSVPELSQPQLVSRVPVYGSLTYLDRNGEPGEGVNTGDIWTFRSYIEGLTKAAAIWKFDNLDVERLKQHDGLRLENRFEAFRTYKGVIGQPIMFRITLVNPTKKLRVTNGDLVKGVAEFSEERQRSAALEEDPAAESFGGLRTESTISIPRTITYIDVSGDRGGDQAKTVDLFDDLIDGNSLTVEVTCQDRDQYLGTAQSDLFIRLPDRGFASTYFKSIFTMWLMLMLICLLGTTASCFVKGPVATLLTFSLFMLGEHLRPQMDHLLKQFNENDRQVLGGGVLESVYRIVLQMNPSQELPDNPAMTIMQWIDRRVFDMLGIFRNVIPNFEYFNTAAYTANGFDVSWNTALLPAIATALAYLLPCVLLGYFSLQLRELEAK